MYSLAYHNTSNHNLLDFCISNKLIILLNEFKKQNASKSPIRHPTHHPLHNQHHRLHLQGSRSLGQQLRHQRHHHLHCLVHHIKYQQWLTNSLEHYVLQCIVECDTEFPCGIRPQQEYQYQLQLLY